MNYPNGNNPSIHTDLIDEEGEVEDRDIATFYNQAICLHEADGYLRITMDAEGHHLETRIDYADLIKAGWTRSE